MPDRIITRRWSFQTPSRIHPCLCGFICDTYPQMKKHRLRCKEWHARPDPRGLSIERRRSSKLENVRTRKFRSCPACHQSLDDHTAECPHNQAEAARRDSFVRHGIDVKDFERFLKVLALCYGTTWDGKV